MEIQNTFESTNINSLWLKNVYENLKNLEMLERLAREGCTELLEYVQMPAEMRQVQLGDIQYKNLKMIITEFFLLITDLTPIVSRDDLEKLNSNLKKIEKIVGKRELFVKDIYSASKNAIVASKTTDFYRETINYLGDLRRKVIESIASILYVQNEEKKMGFVN